MVEPWAAWLAWRAAAGARQHVLAVHLYEYGESGLSHAPTPQPGEAHLRAGKLAAAALRRLRLILVPVWQFPKHLLRVRPLPCALFVRGDPTLLHRRPAIAIIGARRAGPGGCRWAHRLAQRHAAAGALVVSGGALGIDSAAHAGALAAGAPTLAYMGTAIDRIYPPSNADLFASILQANGALASEHPPFATTFKSGHAQRNRFIAAHGERLVVVEAAQASGTLSTVTYADQLGTPVWVAPGDVGGERSGLEQLLAEGRARVHPPA